MLTQTEKVVKIEKDESTQLADNLIREYKKTRWVSNSEKLGKPDSLSAWFSIKEMEDFIREAKENGGDGIKFYYGSFPENYDDHPLYRRKTNHCSGSYPIQETLKLGGISNKDIYIIKDGEAKILGVPVYQEFVRLLCCRDQKEEWRSGNHHSGHRGKGNGGYLSGRFTRIIE